MTTVRYTLDLANPPKLSDRAREFYANKSEDEIEALAFDPDFEPTTDEMGARGVMGRDIRLLREELGLTPDGFSARFCIPLEDLKAWEGASRLPDPVAIAYLRVIAKDPQAVERALSGFAQAAA